MVSGLILLYKSYKVIITIFYQTQSLECMYIKVIILYDSYIM